ncbi:unnamed protein product [Mesocestoides corti]|uniref:Translocon-associated protein subunit alpha n=1 Tax=Mesocestoides corti TaxID=53468 RepID=A0A158QU93_MESCO|nr:unnamed protein product [Mesocestoides corti]
MMLRFALFSVVLLIGTQVQCQDVEIADEEFLTPSKLPTSEDSSVEQEDIFGSSSDINAILNFVNPPLDLHKSAGQISLVAGKQSSFIVWLENRQISSNAYTLYTLEAALHYPRYFGYHIQNFTVQRLHNTLEPKHQATLFYTFTPAAQLAGQHFDLAVILTYHDQTGKPYSHPLFNETIAFLEDGEGMDVELIFLGVMVVGVCILVIGFVWHWISTKASRRAQGSKSSATYNGGAKSSVNVSKTSATSPNGIVHCIYS